MSTFIKRFICIIITLALIICGLYFSSNILQEKHRSMQVDTFYKLPENSVDVLFVGSSRYVRSMASNIIFNETGISSYNRSTELLSAQNQYLYVKDSFKTQSPKVVFLSAARLQNGYNDKRDMHFHFGMAKVNPSFDKFKVALKYQTESDTMYAMDILFPVFKYHYRWNKLEYRDFFSYSQIETRGQDAYWKIHKFDEDEPDFYGRINPDADTEVTYDPIVKDYLDKTINLCKENGAEVVICDAPSRYWTQEKYAAGKAIAEEHNVKFLDCNLDENLEKINSSLETDWQDDHEHMNGWGSYKFAVFMADYLENNFDLPDYRNENNEISQSLKDAYEEYYFRYHMFLPQELIVPPNYNNDNMEKMKKIPGVSAFNEREKKYIEFEEKLRDKNIDFTSEPIDVSGVEGKSGKRYTTSDGARILLVEYDYDSYGHALTSHKRALDFEDYGEFPIIDPVNKSGYIMAFDGTKTKEQAMLLTNIYNSIKK